MVIEDARTEQLARELAALTGETVGEALAEAIRERLERIQTARSAGIAERLIAIGKDCASRMSEADRSLDHAELLYDDKGLPK